MVSRTKQRAYAYFAGVAAALVFAAPAVAFAEGATRSAPSSSRVDLIGVLRVHDAAENHIRAVSTLGNYAYLAAAEEPLPACSLPGGIYVVDISAPATPTQAAFIPTTPGWVAFHGVHALHVDTPSFAGDVLVHTNEVCATAPGPGGISLWNVDDPRNPTPLSIGAGDTDPLPGVPARAHRSRYAHAWDAGDRAFVIMSDFEELGVGDVDIIEITDPRNPRRVAETALASWPGAQNTQSAGIGAQPGAAMTGIRVRNIGGRWLALVAYQDAGEVVLDVSDPANPVFVADSDYADPDPATRLRPEGNATRGDWDRRGRFVIAGDNDTFPYRLVPRIMSGSFRGEEFLAVPGTATRPISPQSPMNGPTYFLGLACGAVPAAPSPDAIAVMERGTCTFQVKFDNMRAAGYQGGIVVNSTVAGSGCEVYATLGATGDRPFLLVARSTGYKILGIAGYDPTRCGTGPNPPLPMAGTPGSSVSITSQFDGWGYARLLDAASLTQIDAYAPPPVLDERYAQGFGNLSINEIVADPTHDIAYSTWYDAGFRVLGFSGSRLREVGNFTADVGADFFGVDLHLTRDGRRFVLAVERDSGLHVFRYGTDLRPTNASSPRTVRVGNVFSYRIPVRNTGTIPETATLLRDRLPRGVRFVSASATRGRCTYRRITRTVVCKIGRLASDVAAAIVTIRVRAQRPGMVVNAATIKGREVEYDTGNNLARLDTRVIRHRTEARLTGRWR
jgi:uncharacterized repeat protein (TIGR01451 family)